MSKRSKSRNIFHSIVGSQQNGQRLNSFKVTFAISYFTLEETSHPFVIIRRSCTPETIQILILFIYSLCCQINSDFFKQVDKRMHLYGIPKLLIDLEKNSTLLNFNIKRCTQIVKVSFAHEFCKIFKILLAKHKIGVIKCFVCSGFASAFA